MSDDRFVTIKKVADPVEAEMLVDLLSQEGIPANTPGAAQAGYLGNIAPAVFEVPLQVPAKHADRAKAILSALHDYDEVDDEDAPLPEMSDEGGPYRGGPAEDAPRPRSKLTAVAASIVLPCILGAFGSGHFYTRRYKTGFVILALSWGTICGATGFNGAVIGLLPVLVALDIWGALRAIDEDAA